MSILTKNEIIKLINEKKIKITPFDKSAIGPASVDLTLANEFLEFKKIDYIDVNKNSDYSKYTKKIVVKKYYNLPPGGYVLGITKETIKLPDNLCGWLGTRSRYARLGIMVHSTAAFVCPGVNNKQVLEIKNVSDCTLRLYPGTKILQIIFEKTSGTAKYNGKFKNQKL